MLLGSSWPLSSSVTSAHDRVQRQENGSGMRQALSSQVPLLLMGGRVEVEGLFPEDPKRWPPICHWSEETHALEPEPVPILLR